MDQVHVEAFWESVDQWCKTSHVAGNDETGPGQSCVQQAMPKFWSFAYALPLFGNNRVYELYCIVSNP